MKRKFLTVLLMLAAALCLCFGLAACDDGTPQEPTGGTQTQPGGEEPHEHTFTDYISDGNATCTEDGTETAHCTHDGCTETDTRTAQGSKLGHNFETYIPNGDATCTEDGTETAHCTHDGCTETDTRTITGSKLGHNFETYTPNGDATCTENGTETAHCTRCTETDTRPAQTGALGHSYDETHYASDDSVHYYACTRCGDKQEGSEAPHTIVNDYECSVCHWHADGTTSLTYSENDDGGYTVTGASNQTLTKIVIPDTYEGKPVTAVAGNAFRGDSKEVGKALEEVVFGKNVARIGYCAFGYTALKSVTIPDSVTVIDKYAFYGCESMETVNIGSGAIGIFDYAFYGCSGVEAVTIEGGSVSIGKYVFQNCAKLKTLTVGEGTVNIGRESFLFSPSLTDVTFGGGKVTIGQWAFQDCTMLETLTIGDGEIEIAQGGFFRCAALTDVTFGSGKVTIGDWAFQGCTELKTLTFGGSDIEIAQGGFFQCASLTGVDFGDGDISIGAYTFQGCAKLETITIGDGDVVLGTDFVWNCQALTDIVIGDGNVEIGEYAFRNCSLEHFTAGEGNINFGYAALWGCQALTDLTVGNGNLVFDAYAVNSCPALTDVTLGNGEISFGDFVFYGCSELTNFNVGNNIADIGDDPFGGCPSLQYNRKDGVKYLGNTEHPYTVLVGAENTNISSVVMDTDTKFVQEYAFSGCQNLASVTFGEHLKKIRYRAFENCVLLQEAIFHDALTEIEHSAFDGCKALKTVTFGNGIQKIGEYAFDGCSAIQTVNISSLTRWLAIEFASEQFVAGTNPLSAPNATLYVNDSPVTDVIIPDGVTELKPLAFAGYAKLNSVQIGKDVSRIGAGALMECKNVTSLTVAAGNQTFAAETNCVYDKTAMSVALGCPATQIPDGIRIIPANVFREIPLSATFVIPDSVEEIGERAFMSCGTFTDLTLGTGLKTVGASAFFGAMAPYYVSVTYHIRDLAKWCEIDFADDGANPLRWESAAIYAAPHAGENETEISNGGAILTIPEGVTEIKAYAFWNISTQELHLPSTVTKIDPTAFGMNGNLSHYVVAAGNSAYEVRDCGVVEIATNTLILGTVPYGYGTIGEGVDKIGDYAFSGKIFTNVTIASSVKEIGAHAFESCTIQSLTLGENVEKIGDWAFAKNETAGVGIGAVVIPGNVTYIGDYAFYQSGVTSLALGEKVEHIGENAFALNHELTSVTIPASVKEIGKSAFWDDPLTEATFADTGWTVTDHYGYDVTPSFDNPADVANALKDPSNTWTKREQ